MGLILERHVPTGGDHISGIHLPEGTVVGINAWVLHQNKVVFGKDASCFRPERWLDSRPEQLKEMRRSLFTVSTPVPGRLHVHLPADVCLCCFSLVRAHEHA